MPADIALDDTTVTVAGEFLLVRCKDLKLDCQDRRSSSSGERRALVHGYNDELVVNWAADYPGGVVIRGDVELPDKIKQNHVRLESHDLHLDHPDRRSSTTGTRRALVHGHDDELVLNWHNDYPGGTVVHGDLAIRNAGKVTMHHVAGSIEFNNPLLGDIALRDEAGLTRVSVSAGDGMTFRDAGGAATVRIDADEFGTSPWPQWEGQPTQSRLDLIAEIRRLKELVVGQQRRLGEMREIQAGLERRLDQLSPGTVDDAGGRRVQRTPGRVGSEGEEPTTDSPLAQVNSALATGRLPLDASVSYRLTGGAPGQRIEETVVLESGGMVRTVVRDELGRLEEVDTEGEVDEATVTEVYELLETGVEGLIAPSEARFVPDSLVGSVEVKVGDRTEVFYFAADEGDRQVRGESLSEAARALISRLDEIGTSIVAGGGDQ